LRIGCGEGRKCPKVSKIIQTFDGYILYRYSSQHVIRVIRSKGLAGNVALMGDIGIFIQNFSRKI
jgi:hypothetical protein